MNFSKLKLNKAGKVSSLVPLEKTSSVQRKTGTDRLARLILKPLLTRSTCNSSGRWGLKMNQRNNLQAKSIRE